MTIKEIITEWLKQNKYDGLYNPDDCGCEISDLMPCDIPHVDCSPGYKVVCPEGHEYDFIITANKEDSAGVEK